MKLEKMIKKSIIFFAIAVLALVVSACEGNAGKEMTTLNIGGTYKFGSSAEKGPVGSVKMYPLTDNSALFYLDVCQGAPSYNSGRLFGQMTITDNVGTYESQSDDCFLKFKFAPQQLEVIQNYANGSCGFGGNVNASKTYKLIDKSIPKYYIDGEGGKILFSSKIVENQYDNKLPQINEQFKSYFPDMTLGKYIENPKPIPHKVAAKFLPDFIGAGLINVKFYAVGKIINFKGLDLFVIGYEGERPDEDHYDNHVDKTRFILLFKNDTPLTEVTDYGRTERLKHQIDLRYYGEGGNSLYKSYFDNDFNIITHAYSSQMESATGYGLTPLIETKEYSSTLNESGKREVLEVRQLEYSSPFYDREFLKKQNWEDIEQFPRKGRKWYFHINLFSYWSEDEAILTNSPMDFSFHIERINGELMPVFESYTGNKPLDRYIVGQSQYKSKSEKDYSARTKILKCPIIIKTSDGNLELLPNGKFLLQSS